MNEHDAEVMKTIAEKHGSWCVLASLWITRNRGLPLAGGTIVVAASKVLGWW